MKSCLSNVCFQNCFEEFFQIFFSAIRHEEFESRMTNHSASGVKHSHKAKLI